MSTRRQSVPEEEATEFIGPRLRELREQQHVSVVELARRLNVSRNRIYQLEHPDADLKLSTVLRYCDAIGVRIEIST